MKKLLIIIATAAVLMFASQLYAAPIISQGSSGWEYFEIDDLSMYEDLRTNSWDHDAYMDVTWNHSNAPSIPNIGTAAFGNTGTTSKMMPFGVPWLPSTTSWQHQTSLVLRKEFHIADPTLLSDVFLNVANDNGFVVFINEHKVANNRGDGFTNYWEYNYQLNPLYFQAGWNKIEIIAVDDPQDWATGDATFFDMELTANINPIPVPTTIILFVTGLAALVGIKRRTA